jgi:hypothetical protein
LRWLALASGALLVVIAFVTGGQVADTRQGLIFEVIALLAGLGGVSLLLFGLLANRSNARLSLNAPPRTTGHPQPRIPSADELLIGGGGLVLSAVLITGLGVSAGPPWALLGLILLLPMVIGAGYLCIRFIRAPQRDWTIDLRRLTRHR